MGTLVHTPVHTLGVPRPSKNLILDRHRFPDLKKPHSRPPQVSRPQKTAFSTATGSQTLKNRILDRHRFPDLKKPHSRPPQVPRPPKTAFSTATGSSTSKNLILDRHRFQTS